MLTRKPVVFLSIPGALPAANLLRSAFLPTLRKAGPKLVILTPYVQDLDFVSEFSVPGEVTIEDLPTVPQTAMEGRLRGWAFVSLCERAPNGSTRVMREHYLAQLAARRGKWEILRQRLQARLVARFPPKIWLTLANRFNSNRVYDSLFERYQPDLVLTCAPGVYQREIPLLREALARRLPTMAIHMSWDHLTTKLRAFYKVNRLVVWNEWMKRDAVERFDYNPEHVYIAGVPHWDLYVHDDYLLNRADFCQQLGLDPDRKLIVLTTVGPEIYPDHEEIIQTLLQAIHTGALGRPVELLIRLHPHDDLELYQNFVGQPGLVVELPYRPSSLSERGLHLNIDQANRYHLANTLYHADVVINVASTITIEACIYDTPVVNIAYSSSGRGPVAVAKVEDVYQFEHYRRIVDTGGVRLAYSPEELVDWVRRYLADPALDQEGRRRIVQEQAAPVDGRAAARTAECVLAYLEQVRVSHRRSGA